MLDPAPSSGRGQRPRWLALGRALALMDPSARVRALLDDAAALGLDRDALEQRSGLVELDPVLGELRDAGHILPLGEQRWVAAAAWASPTPWAAPGRATTGWSPSPRPARSAP